MTLEFWVLLSILALTGWMHKSKLQQQRKALLARHLQPYQIETMMETLTEGYLRALGESDLARQSSIWSMLASTEATLSAQFQNFVRDFSQLDAISTQLSNWPLCVPCAEKIAPQSTFDMRKAFGIHAHGISRAIDNIDHCSPKDKAFTITAEMLLMQHSCHWFCKSKTVASARMLARHQTPYTQLLAAVSPETRQAYLKLVGH
jgi:hypothetical protein